MPPQSHWQKEERRLLEVTRKKTFQMPSSRRVHIYALPKGEAARFTAMGLYDFAVMLTQQIRAEEGRVVGFRTNPDTGMYEYLAESLQWEYIALAREETDPFEDVPVFPLKVRAATGQVQQ